MFVIVYFYIVLLCLIVYETIQYFCAHIIAHFDRLFCFYYLSHTLIKETEVLDFDIGTVL
jgi:hypothetical protein